MKELRIMNYKLQMRQYFAFCHKGTKALSCTGFFVNLGVIVSSWLLSVTLCTFSFTLSAQTTVQVVTKMAEKSVLYVAGNVISIKGERSSIHITGWNRNEVYIKIKMISKHTDKATAEKELSYIRYAVNKSGNDLHRQTRAG